MDQIQNNSEKSFNYSLVNDEVANYLKERVSTMRKIVSNNATKVGEQLYLSQQKMADFNNDGMFGKWLESVGFSRSSAYNYINRYNAVQQLDNENDIKQFESLPQKLTYDISKPSAPKEAVDAVMSGDITTHKEYKELEKKLKQSEEANKTLDGLLSEKADTIKALNQQIKDKPQPEVVEKTVTKEVKPTDYDDLKQKAKTFDGLKKRNDYIEKAYQDLLEKRKDVDHDAAKMRDLEEQIKNLHGQLNEKQKHELAYKRTSEFIKKANQMLDQISPLIYAYDYEDLDEKGQAYTQLKRLVSRVNKWANDLNKVIGDQQIIEGDFTNG